MNKKRSIPTVVLWTTTKQCGLLYVFITQKTAILSIQYRENIKYDIEHVLVLNAQKGMPKFINGIHGNPNTKTANTFFEDVVAGSIPAGVIGIFIAIKSFRSYYGPGVDSASNRNEYQEHLLGVKAAGA